jgi:pimeloyl-ACP methyl ester carboxylesterase
MSTPRVGRHRDGTVAVHRHPSAPDGHGGSPTIGFVHGLGATGVVWRPVLDAMPATWDLLTFAMPWDAAQGGDWAHRPDPETWLTRALQLPDRPPDVLVAHSFAANVALRLLSADPGAGPRALVLVSPFYRGSPDAVDWSVLSHYVNGFQGLLKEGLLAGAGDRLDEGLVDAMADRVRDRIGPYGWLRFFTLFAGTPMLDLAALTMPCLVIGGGDDTASYPADCEALARRLPRGSSAILPGCGHFAMVDNPTRTAGLLTDFVSGVVEALDVDGRPRANGAQR